MTEEIVRFETAKILKEKGFLFSASFDLYETCGWKYFGKHHNTEEIIPLNVMFWDTHPNSQQFIDLKISAPTQTQVSRWLREIYKLHIEIIGMVSGDLEISYSFWIRNLKNYSDVILNDKNYSSYEDCLEEGILYTLNLI